MSIRSFAVVPVLGLVLGIMVLDAPSAEAGHYYRSRYHRSHAQVGVYLYPHGLYVGGGLVGSRVLHQDGGGALLDHGAGLSLFGGFRVNRSLALEAGWLGTVHGPGDTAFGNVNHLVLNGFTADARVYWQTASPELEPFIQGGVGLYLLDSTYFGTQSVGTGFQAGGGFDLILSDHVKLGVRALYRGMAMGPPDAVSADTYVGALSLEGSLVLQF
jgi:hypothetical protein